ncbi:MAG TPA: sigma-54 dependent transcriptional regulator [Candidatus Angelobacter sp.]|nr:sigma-54 dependent transcriptional regulator [Candidatus Angelobacter sp.]
MLQKVIVFAQKEAPAASFNEALRMSGCEMLPTHSEAQFLEAVDQCSPECMVVLSSATVDAEAVRLTEGVRRIDPRCPIVVMTASVSAEGAICAMRAGASDMLVRDAPREKIIATLKSLIGRHPGKIQPLFERDDLIDGQQLAGNAPIMRQIRSQIAKIAAVDVSVLITGETGTGKELVAQLIHRNSRCSVRPFVAINCAAVPDALLESELFGYERGAFTGATSSREGKLEHASGGTLFLDEIGDMSLLAQAKILRALESRAVQRLGSNINTPVQVRLIAATNQDLEIMTKEKKFRDDLYFRLNVVRLALPPLRERLEDIPELVEHIVRELSQKHKVQTRRIEDDLMRRLKGYHWPGNVRELRNLLESVTVLSSSRSVGMADVPAHIRHTLQSSRPKYGDERSKIINALTSTDWNRNKAAHILCCSRMTLYRKMVKYSIPTE